MPGDALAELARIAESQLGVFHRDQGRRAGLSEDSLWRLSRAGVLTPLLPSVFKFPGAPDSFRQRAMAAHLWAGPTSAVSHTTAGALLELDGIKPHGIEVTVATRCRSPVEWLRAHKMDSLPPDEIATAGAIPLTDAARTILDLGHVRRDEIVEQAFEDAVRRNLCDFADLDLMLRRHAARGRNGVGVLRRVLEGCPPGATVTASVFERRLLRLLTRAGLPEPIKRFPVRDEYGVQVAEADLAYPELLLAIEADSYRFHSGRDSWERNLDRRNLLTSLGWHVLHVSWRRMTRHPEQVLRNIRRATSRFVRDIPR